MIPTPLYSLMSLVSPSLQLEWHSLANTSHSYSEMRFPLPTGRAYNRYSLRALIFSCATWPDSVPWLDPHLLFQPYGCDAAGPLLIGVRVLQWILSPVSFLGFPSTNLATWLAHIFWWISLYLPLLLHRRVLELSWLWMLHRGSALRQLPTTVELSS